jgi:hypothetical protein
MEIPEEIGMTATTLGALDSRSGPTSESLWRTKTTALKLDLESLRSRMISEINKRDAVASEVATPYNVTSFQQIELAITDGHTIRAYTPELPKGIRLSYTDFGQENKNRKTPTKTWEAFIECIEGEGLLTAVRHPSLKAARKKVKSRIKKMLQTHFGLRSEDPFYRYQRLVGWRLKMKIRKSDGMSYIEGDMSPLDV